jgi:hypothetical protein
MAILCETYSSQAAARRAVGELRTAGVPKRDVELLIGFCCHDVRSERVGGFAGVVEPSAPVGRYAGPPRQCWQAAGGFHGVPDRQRQGSFADVEAINIVCYDHGSERSRLAGDRGAGQRLAAAGVTGEAARRLIDDLHWGHTVLLGEITSRDVQTGHAGLAHAA